MKRIIILAFLVFFLTLVSSAVAEVSVSILQGKATDDKKAALFFSVVDDAGKPIKGLSKENLKLVVEGEKIANFTVQPVSTTQGPLSLVLGIDVSGSMKGKPFEGTKKAVHSFLFQLDKEDFVSLLSFGTEVKILADFIKEKDRIWAQVEPLGAVDMWTHLYDATHEAVTKAKGAPTSRAAVILLTDGRDEGSKGKTRNEAIDIARGASIPVFTIGFGHQIDKEYLKEIAEVSGGYFLFTPDPGAIAGLYSKVLEQLRNQYVITFDFAKNPGFYKAALTLNYGNKEYVSKKQFEFNPEGTPPGLQELLRGITWQQGAIGGVILLAVIAAVIALVFVYLKRRKREWIEELRGIWGDPAKPASPGACYLEYPKEVPTDHEFILSRSGKKANLEGGEVSAFLQVDCMKNKKIILMYQGREVITDLIIARESAEQRQHKKEGVVYLWVPPERKGVSRPSEDAPGHARIFYLPDSERFVIENLKETPTYFGENNVKLSQGEQVPLRDGDIIDVGEKGEGIRIIYWEGEIKAAREEKDDYDEGTITGSL